jgi:hypothetical protein
MLLRSVKPLCCIYLLLHIDVIYVVLKLSHKLILNPVVYVQVVRGSKAGTETK